VPDQTAEARIRDLERRLDLDPGSRLFVSLAEEYRKVGRLKDALSALQKGLLAHPGYVAAQVALGRVYVEAKQTTDAVATFTKVLQADPGNLVAARSLADIYYDRGDNLEALKKFKLYRALSGDRKVDAIIAKIEPKVAPLPITPLKKIINTAEPPPPPPSFQDTAVARSRPTMSRIPVPPSSDLSDPFDVTSLAFDPGEDSGKGARDEGPLSAIPTRDMFIAPPPKRAPSAPTPPPAAEEPAPPPPIFAAVPETAPPPAPHEPTPIEPAAARAAPEPAGLPPPEPEPPPPPSRIIDDLEETQAIRGAARRPESEDLFQGGESGSHPADLPEPPALFIAPPAPAEAGEIHAEPEAPSPRAAVSLEPREFPPPYDDHGQAPAEPPAPPPAAPQAGPAGEAHGSSAPTGRALADLYYAQGHYAEALQIYDDLVTRHPFDEDLKRMRRDAEARLLPAASSPGVSSADPGLERRLARVRVLKRWLGRIQDSERSSAAPGP